MLLTIALIFSAAMIFSLIIKKTGLPELLGMIAAGIILGPYVLDLISDDVLNISSELRTAALIVILIRAGLGINRDTLNTIGIPALKMSFIPCILEGTIITISAKYILNIPLYEAGVLGFIIAAVSPAVVVPQMLLLKEQGLGKNKEVPTLILAGASIDDVFAITLFSVFLGLASGKFTNIFLTIFMIPLGIVSGVVIGLILGIILVLFFKKYHIRDTKKVIIFMMIAIFFYELCDLEIIKKIIPIASLIGIMTIGFIILEKYDVLAKRLAIKFGKVWVFAEVILFVLIGAQVNIKVAFDSGLYGLAIITIGLLFRSFGVFISLISSHLNYKEKSFCILAYIPKATVQAAIGAVPLAAGIASGEIILAIAVLSIIITAPLGSVAIKLSAPHLLEPNPSA